MIQQAFAHHGIIGKSRDPCSFWLLRIVGRVLWKSEKKGGLDPDLGTGCEDKLPRTAAELPTRLAGNPVFLISWSSCINRQKNCMD
jgi:hypothetical protein